MGGTHGIIVISAKLSHRGLLWVSFVGQGRRDTFRGLSPVPLGELLKLFPNTDIIPKRGNKQGRGRGTEETFPIKPF